MLKKVSIFCLLTAVMVGVSWGAIPQTVTFQGRLLRTDGSVEPGPKDVTFKIFDRAGGGRQVPVDQPWAETLGVDPDDATGIFTVALGMANPIPLEAFNELPRFLAIEIEGEELGRGGRQELTSVPFAFVAGKANNIPDTITKEFQTFNCNMAVLGQLSVNTPLGAGDYKLEVGGPVKITGGNLDIVRGDINITGNYKKDGRLLTDLIESRTPNPIVPDNDARTQSITGALEVSWGGVFNNPGREEAKAVIGRASDSGGHTTNYGGYFEAAGGHGRGVYGGVSGNSGVGVEGKATLELAGNYSYGGRFSSAGRFGRGVWGKAENEDTSEETYGGVFYAMGLKGIGVYGGAEKQNTNEETFGGSFHAKGLKGVGVYGKADNENSEEWTYGGKFRSAGLKGIGVYGEASKAETEFETFGGSFRSYGKKGVGIIGKAFDESTEEETYGGKFFSAGKKGRGIYAEASQDTSEFNTYGGKFLAKSIKGRGVHGEASSAASDAESFGGYFKTAGGKGVGVYGEAGNEEINDENYGGFFKSKGLKGRGLYAEASNTTTHQRTFGGAFKAKAPTGRGVYGRAEGSEGIGVLGEASRTGNVINIGGYFTAMGDGGYGVRAIADGPTGRAIMATTDGDNAKAIFAEATGEDGYAVHAISTLGKAGYFDGRVDVRGTLTKSLGSFLIDHPLDPQNKTLQHSFVESPDMKNIYDGVIILDKIGRGVVELPNYFEVLNKDFRYQLTSLGVSSPGLYIAEKIENNRFIIAGGIPGQEVSWQVTGIRNDAYARKHPIVVEEEKTLTGQYKKGEYIHADCFEKDRERVAVSVKDI